MMSDAKSCSVCGDRANYCFYGALACDSCRSFFRRSVLKPRRNPLCILSNSTCATSTSCSSTSAENVKENSCVINVNTRRDCVKCRFEKCLKVGMKKNLVCIATKEALKSKSTSGDASKELVISPPQVLLSFLTLEETGKFENLMRFVNFVKNNPIPKRPYNQTDFIQLRNEFEFVSQNCLRLYRSTTVFDSLPMEIQYNLSKRAIPRCIILRASLFLKDASSALPTSLTQFHSNLPFEFKKICDLLCSKNSFYKNNLTNFLLKYYEFISNSPEALTKDLLVAVFMAVLIMYLLLFNMYEDALPLSPKLKQEVAYDYTVLTSLMDKIVMGKYGREVHQRLIGSIERLDQVTSLFEQLTLYEMSSDFLLHAAQESVELNPRIRPTLV